MSTINEEEKNRKLRFDDDATKINLIPPLTKEEIVEQFYSHDEINNMKESALMENSGVTEEDITAKGHDMFHIIGFGFKHASLERVSVRDLSPIRSSLSPIKERGRNKPVDLGNSLFPNDADDGSDEKQESRDGDRIPKESITVRPPPKRERRPRGGVALRRSRSSNAAPTRTDSLASRTLQRGAPRRTKSNMAPPRGGSKGLSDLSQMQLSIRKLASTSEP